MYAAGSKLFQAVVVLSAGAHAHASCCGGDDHAASGQGHVHDLADAGERDSDFPDSDADDAAEESNKGADSGKGMGDMLGGLGDMMKGMDLENMDFEAMLKNMGGMDGMQDMLKGMGGMEGLGDMMKGMGGEAPPPPPQEEEVTEEQFIEAKEKLELSDEDMASIVDYVSQVPAHFKDEKMSDEKLSQMFVYHYLNGEPDEQDLNEDGTQKEKNRQNLLDEVKHLVEVEIPGIEAEEKAAREAAEAKKAEEAEAAEAAATEAAPEQEDDGAEEL